MARTRFIQWGLLATIALTGCEEASPAAPDQRLDGPSATTVASNCPNGLHKRSSADVLDDLRAALAIGDLDAAICNYDPAAVVISDGGIDRGHDQIRSSLAFFLAIYGGTQPQVVQQIAQPLDNRTDMVRLLYTIDTECIAVPDGIDTYIIRSGVILGQTAHGFPVFLCF